MSLRKNDDRTPAEPRTKAPVDLLEGILEGSQDLIAAMDTGFRLIFFNKAFREEVRRIHGIEIDIGSNLIEALSHVPADRDKARCLWSRALSGEAFSAGAELGEAGRRQAYEIRFTPLPDAQGNIVGAAHIVRNVSDRVRAEESLRQSMERFQNLVETVNDWVWEVDRNGVYTYVSPRIRDLLGYEPEELIGKTPFDFMPDSEGERVGGIFGAIVEKRQPFRALENTNCHKNGEWVVLETSGVPFFDAEGNLLGYRGVDRDISERRSLEKEREQLLEENRRRLAIVEGIFDATQDGIAIYDADGKVLRMNAAAKEFLGLTPEEQAMDITRRWALLRVTKRDGKALALEEIPNNKALAGEKAQAILHFQPPRRPPRWFSLSAAPIRSVDADPARAVTFLTDITEFHGLQQEHEIFMQMISHDLRTPITVIRGHAEMLEQRLTEKDETTVLNVEAILASAHHLNGMMEDLTQMIHLERGQLPLRLEPVDIPEFVTRLVTRLTLIGIGRQVEESFPPDLPPVQADADSLERILANLLTNAFKYSPPEVPVKVAAKVVEREVWISVTDRGKGISPEDQPYLFDRFFRTMDAGERRGIGLGLYITRRLAEAHGGRIWMDSEPGKGSTFTFSIPLQQEERH